MVQRVGAIRQPNYRLGAALRDACALSLGLRHISLCHSSCVASLAPSACALAKGRQPLVVSCNRLYTLEINRYNFFLTKHN
ncbi:hypothetical protein EHQ57_10110 [Leptospira wolffii]|nr:hypothetical protein EHQ35_15045 [Leptospira wolffii]TGL29282.1 hypothetical protein EHQ57_10110 [Leptospira wolffii]